MSENREYTNYAPLENKYICGDKGTTKEQRRVCSFRQIMEMTCRGCLHEDWCKSNGRRKYRRERQ